VDVLPVVLRPLGGGLKMQPFEAKRLIVGRANVSRAQPPSAGAEPLRVPSQARLLPREVVVNNRPRQKKETNKEPKRGSGRA
jgi:hypothetical protein